MGCRDADLNLDAAEPECPAPGREGAFLPRAAYGRVVPLRHSTPVDRNRCEISSESVATIRAILRAMRGEMVVRIRERILRGRLQMGPSKRARNVAPAPADRAKRPARQCNIVHEDIQIMLPQDHEVGHHDARSAPDPRRSGP